MVEAIFPPKPLSSSDLGFIKECIEVLITLLKLHGMDVTGWRTGGTLNHWYYCAAASPNAKSFVKYKISAYYAFHKGSCVAEAPCGAGLDNPAILLGGRAYAFMNKFMRRTRPQEFDDLLTGVLYSKGGMPKSNEAQLKKAEQDTYTKLTTAPLQKRSFLIDWFRTDDVAPFEVLLAQQTVESQIRRTVREVFGRLKGKYTLEDRIAPFFPSTSANYNNSRALGGAVGAILTSPDLMVGLKSEIPLIRTDTRESYDLSGKRYQKYTNVDDRPLRAHFSVLYQRILSKALKELPTAVLLAIAEPLKERTISKGPPFHYTVLKPLQRFLHRELRKHPCFSLTGDVLESLPFYVQERMGAKLKEDEVFLSVDYKDATNEIFSWATEAYADEICVLLEIPDTERRLVFNSLVHHIMLMRKGAKGLPQARGQLMGSILSFDALCVINAAICRWSQEVAYLRHFTLIDARLAINGDDAIMRIPVAAVGIWEEIASFVGLSPSVGKVYQSKVFLNINSQSYDYYPEGYESRRVGFYHSNGPKGDYRLVYFRPVSRVNLGLLLDVQKSGIQGDGNGRERTLGARCRKLVETSPYYLRERVLGRFIHMNSVALKKYPIPWFLPESLGGLGLPPVGKYQPKRTDLRMARKIHDNPAKFRLPKSGIAVPWEVWRYAIKRFPNPPSLNYESQISGADQMLSHNQLLSLACVESLFCTKGLGDLCNLIDIDRSVAVVSTHGGDFTPLSVLQRKRVKAFNISALTGTHKFYRSLADVWAKTRVDKSVPVPEPYRVDSYPMQWSSDDVPSYFNNPLYTFIPVGKTDAWTSNYL